MSPLADLAVQRRATETGRIRLGVQRRTKGGKAYPAKLDAYRFTTSSEHAARAVADLLGGQATRWEDAPVGEQWEVLTEARSIDVAVPPGDAAISQWYELWSGGGCQRRCDGFREQIRGTACLCPPAGQERAAAASGINPTACKPTTRVSLIIPDLPGIGVWRLESHGYYAAVELGGAAELLAAAREHGVIVPARLRIDQRRVARPGSPPKEFPVPVLEVLPTLRQMTQLASGAQTLAAQLPPQTARAIAAAPAGPTTGSTTGQQPAVQAQRPAGEQRPRTGRQQAVPPREGPDPLEHVDTAQKVAALALDATTEAELLALGQRAADRGWLGDFVAGPGDVQEELRPLLLARLDAVRRPPATGDWSEQEPPEEDR